MIKNEMLDMAIGKTTELGHLVESKSGNKNPDYYKTLKEHKLWCIIQGLLENMGDEEVHISYLTETYFKECAAGIKRAVVIEVHEGDDVMELLEKYDGVKDIYKKLKKACEDAGLMIDGPTIVKA